MYIYAQNVVLNTHTNTHTQTHTHTYIYIYIYNDVKTQLSKHIEAWTHGLPT